MARPLSPVLRRELENLEKDADSRKSAMKALKSYVKDLDSKAIPQFLAQVSETKEARSSSVEHTISLYEVLARAHGPKIVSQIDNIMCSIIKTLTTSGGSFPLQQACSKVVPAIARYGIEPTTPKEKKAQIIQSLCKPLSGLLLVTQECLSCGAALCLRALVDCDNWRFASDELVNEVCLRLTGALKDERTQTSSHMGLVMSLAKRNSFIVEAYDRLLIQAGLRILNAGSSERNSQKRLMAIQMVHSLMKYLDIRSIWPELEMIADAMEKRQSDQMPYVRGAALEALHTARRMMADKGSKFDSDSVSVTGSNFGRSDTSQMRYSSSPGNRSPLFGSPESRTLDSFGDFDSLIDSPISRNQVSPCLSRNCKIVNRRLWSYENGGVDISLRDGLVSEIVNENSRSHSISEQDEASDNQLGYINAFSGFLPVSPSHNALRSQTPSPQRPRSQINVGNIKLFTTPRKLIHSLQDRDDMNYDYSANQLRKFRSPCSSKCESSPVPRHKKNGVLLDEVDLKDECNVEKSVGVVDFQSVTDSVSSIEDVPLDAHQLVAREAIPRSETETQKRRKLSHNKVASGVLAFLFLMAFAVFVSVLWLDEQDAGYNLIPT